MTTITHLNPGAQAGVQIPKDVEDFLLLYARYYGTGDINRIMSLISDDFLHQGMNKRTFEGCLRRSYLLKYSDWIKITFLDYRREGNMAEIAGYAESNLGVMPAAEDALPLLEGTKLILRDDSWKLLGNQSRSRLGLYKVFHQLSAFFVPQDRSLYRSLLPAIFEVPPEAMVFVKVTDFEQVRLPLPPYKVAHVQILADYKGLQGWYTLTMPETEWIPVEMGKLLGYPKYVADSIVFRRTHNGWEAQVTNDGENSTSLSIQFEQDQSQASVFERLTSKHPLTMFRKLLPPFIEKPWYLLMPIKSGNARDQALLLRGEPPISGIPKVQESFGRAHLSVETNQPWAGLFPSEVNTRGVFMQFSGELALKHSMIAR